MDELNQLRQGNHSESIKMPPILCHTLFATALLCKRASRTEISHKS